VPGGEDQLKDYDQGNYDEWIMNIMQPWWEPELPQRPVQHPLFGPSQSAASSMPESRHDNILTGPNSRYSYLLPLPLLAPFTENSTATGVFPAGYYCKTCGRINVQRFLRHRICEGTACDSRADPQTESGWALGWALNAFSTCDRKVNSATVVPDDKWAAPTIAGPETAFDDGASLFLYHLAAGDSGADADAHPHSVRHVFNGNKDLLQQDATALFETLQRDVRIERCIGASSFSTPQIESGDDPVLGRNGRSIWDQQVAVIESALSKYCHDLGPLKVRALRVHAWVSDGKVRTPPSCSDKRPLNLLQNTQMFCPRAKHIVLLCLGADIAFLSDPNTKSSAKPKDECLRVTMVHGDVVVLSGRQFKAKSPILYLSSCRLIFFDSS
jgi:hypothetical protein